MRVHFKDSNATGNLTLHINKMMAKAKYQGGQQIIIACIGTDRCTGDALGPYIGNLLADKEIPAKVYGNIDNPVHANNLDNTASIFNKDDFVIAIDAGLGKQSSVGCIDVCSGPLKPGSGVNKELTPVGNMHITGLVNVSGHMEYMVLQSTRLSVVINMAEIIAESLDNAICELLSREKVKKAV